MSVRISTTTWDRVSVRRFDLVGCQCGDRPVFLFCFCFSFCFAFVSVFVSVFVFVFAFCLYVFFQ